MSDAALIGRLQLIATGKLKDHGMNKTEARYALQLEALRQRGEIVWWLFEGMKLRLADNTTYTPDFNVLRHDGALEMHETKGFWRDDARVKIKVAAALFPFRFIAITERPKKDGGGWKVESFE